jgi:hypothetical protein
MTSCSNGGKRVLGLNLSSTGIDSFGLSTIS